MNINYKCFLSFRLIKVKLLPLQFMTISLFLLLVSNAQVLKTIERKQIFDYDWKFTLGDTINAGAKVYNDNNWRNLDLPHDWSIEGKIEKANPTGGAGGFFPAGIGWYRKAFKVPVTWKNKQVTIYFEGVYMNAEVFINGTSLGVHPYGYTGFMYDLTPYLEKGKANVIAVRVNNAQQPNSRWYSGSGIYRHVWMMVTNPLHIANWGSAVTTPSVTPTKAIINIKTTLKNETDTLQNIILKTSISYKNAQTNAKAQNIVRVLPKSSMEISQNIVVSKPILWSPETPTLYKAQVQLVKGNVIADEVPIDFGIRSIKFSTDSGFQLNGKTLKLNGGCVHHDNGCLGAAAFDWAEERKISLLKAAGFNAVRTSHNPPSEAFLAACDKLGMLVIDEAFDGWKTTKTKYDYCNYFKDWWQRDLESMLLRDRNHPSIIMWSIGNEVIERKKPEAVETAKALADFVHKTDSTRPVTSAMTTWDKEWEIFDPLMAAHDIAGYNYQLHRAKSDHERVPSRIIVHTESFPRDAFTNWKLVIDNSYILGDFVWTAWDYLGESGIGRWYHNGEPTVNMSKPELFPNHGAYCGDIDLTGWRKPVSHYRSMLYNNNEKLYMAVREPEIAPDSIHTTTWAVWPTWESWTWPGFEGKSLQVEVYSKFPKVRLYRNSTLIGEKITSETEKFMAKFSVPYEQGELRAYGVMDEKNVDSCTLTTASGAAKLKLTADRKTIKANGQDVSYVAIEVTDAKGVLQANAENNLHFSIEGQGTIAGVDNANLKDTASYVSSVRNAWNGRALVVIKSSKKVGLIKLTVSSQGLASETITVNVK